MQCVCWGKYLGITTGPGHHLSSGACSLVVVQCNAIRRGAVTVGEQRLGHMLLR